MIVFVCGNAYFNDMQLMKQTLDDIHQSTPITAILFAHNNSITQQVIKWCGKSGVKSRNISRDGPFHSLKKGVPVNINFNKYKPDLVLIFEGPSETEEVVTKANTNSIPITTITQ